MIKIILIFNKYSNQLKFQIVEKPFTTIPEPQGDMAKKCKCLEQFGNLGQTMYTINDLMVEESIEEVYFILNGNNQAHKSTAAILGAKYLGVFSSHSLKTREKYISFAQFVYFLREVCLLFNF